MVVGVHVCTCLTYGMSGMVVTFSLKNCDLINDKYFIRAVARTPVS